MAASDIGLVTNVFLEMYNSGQESKKWFLDEVMYAHDKKVGKWASVICPISDRVPELRIQMRIWVLLL